MSDEQQISEITSYIIANGHNYFINANPQTLQVSHMSTIKRPYATLLRYAITGPEIEQYVIAKMHHLSQSPNLPTDRPRRFYTPFAEKYKLYANILKQIETLMQQTNDDRFDFIRLLDTLPESQTLIMTEIQGTDLRKPFLQHNRLQGFFTSFDLQKIFFNIGEWLATFHALEPDDYVETYATEVDSLRDDIDKIIRYLTKNSSKDLNLHRTQHILESHINTILTDDIPTGRMHGDFTLRNIMMNEKQRIVVLDTLGNWYTPIYEDIAYFLVRLWTNKLQVFTLGYAYDPNWIKQCEQSFLAGYFGHRTVSTKIIAFYKIIMLLDQWSSMTEALKVKSNKNIDKIRFQLTITHYHRLLKMYLEQLT